MTLALTCFGYQVFKTYCNEDYDRRNEEVDPVASSAEYELEKRVEKLELLPVELEKGEQQDDSITKETSMFFLSNTRSILLTFYFFSQFWLRTL